MSPYHRFLIERLRDVVEEETGSAERNEAADVITALVTNLEIATQELKNIANADTIAWDDPTQFEAWAKSRARFALGKIGGQADGEGV